MIRAILICAALSGAVCQAAPYWISYEATDSFPEDEGWQRITHAGGAQRYFEDGALVLDGLASTQIVDLYQMQMGGALDPGPGEVFVAQWRLRIDEVIGYSDPGMGVYSDESCFVGFSFREDTVLSLTEPGVSAWFQPGLYHDFELRSADMRFYELLIDGESALTGAFHHLLSASQVGWGDAGQGAASLSRWDHFRFGVIPEPRGLALVIASGASLLLSGVRRGRAVVPRLPAG